jgi:hypothetical protein
LELFGLATCSRAEVFALLAQSPFDYVTYPVKEPLGLD